MPSDTLTHYLQDHLAGSVAALQLMETLADHESGRPLEQKLRDLHAEVAQEQETVRDILARLDGDESRLKQVAAWLTEKMHAARLVLMDRSHPALARLGGLESLALGLQGKLALYRALADVAPGDPTLGGYPFDALEARTLVQHAMIEEERMAAAHEALTGAESAVSATGAPGTSAATTRDGAITDATEAGGSAAHPIVRLWHGYTRPADADAYERLLREEIFHGIASRAIPGYRGIELLRRADGDAVEFVTLMRFDSLEAVRAFAGADHEVAVVPPAARALLLRYDPRSAHYELRDTRAEARA